MLWRQQLQQLQQLPPSVVGSLAILAVVSDHCTYRSIYETLLVLAFLSVLNLFLKVGLSQPLFLNFLIFYFNVQLIDTRLLMLGFEPCISGVGSDALPTEPQPLPPLCLKFLHLVIFLQGPQCLKILNHERLQ